MALLLTSLVAIAVNTGWQCATSRYSVARMVGLLTISLLAGLVTHVAVFGAPSNGFFSGTRVTLVLIGAFSSVVFAACGLVGLVTSVMIERRRCAGLPGYCASCGYDQAGNVSGRCPDCGTKVPADGGSDAGQ